jgi:hypothetical protein
LYTVAIWCHFLDFICWKICHLYKRWRCALPSLSPLLLAAQRPFQAPQIATIQWIQVPG